MAKVFVSFDKIKGKIKPVHGVGQPPFSGTNFNMISYLTEANIPYSRLHDVGGPYGGFRWVDIPNIFRDFDADPYDPASYDFAFTDLLIKALVDASVEPVYRLGVSIENAHNVRAYRIFPPTDFKKWSVICEHIIRHYNEGWADGFYYNITYWEIWNEPDNSGDLSENAMWQGTMQEYFELYETASKHLKSCFPYVKVGGYASSGLYQILKHYVPEAKTSPRREYFITFMDKFLRHVKEKDCPLDFFSWHSYDGIEANVHYANYVRRRLDEEGFEGVETSCNEWNFKPSMRGTGFHAAHLTAMLLAFQDLPVDTAMFYDARFGTSAYGGMFNPLTAKPFPAYYGFKCFGELYRLGEQAESHAEGKGIYAVAAAKNGVGALLIANVAEAEVPLEISLGGARVISASLFAEGEETLLCHTPTSLPRESFLFVKVEL